MPTSFLICQLFPFSFRFTSYKGAVSLYFLFFSIFEISAIEGDHERCNQWLYASAERLSRSAKFSMIFPNGSAEFWRIGACLLHFFFPEHYQTNPLLDRVRLCWIELLSHSVFLSSLFKHCMYAPFSGPLLPYQDFLSATVLTLFLC